MEVSIIAGAAAFAGAVISLAPLGHGKLRATHRLSSLEEGHEELARRAERADSRLRELDALSLETATE